MKRQRGGSQTRFKRRFGLGAVRLRVPSLHATLVLFWDSHPDVVRLIPGLKRIKTCLLFVSSSGKKKKLQRSSPVWYGEARRFSLGLGILQELAQIILLSNYFPQELQFLCWICKTQPTATRWRQDGKSAAAAQRAAEQSTPRSARVCVCLFACARTHVRQERAAGTRATAGAREKWASSRCKRGEARRRRGECDWWRLSSVKQQPGGIYRNRKRHKGTNMKHADVTFGFCRRWT